MTSRRRRCGSATCGWSATTRCGMLPSMASMPSTSAPGASPVMDAFTPIAPGTLYSKGRGYGLKNAQIWRAFDVLQPDPLYQDFICIESGGLAVDVPNGRYRVFVNIDNPSGFWGENQVYRQRAILAKGKPVVNETMDFDAFQRKYYRFGTWRTCPATTPSTSIRRRTSRRRLSTWTSTTGSWISIFRARTGPAASRRW